MNTGNRFLWYSATHQVVRFPLGTSLALFDTGFMNESTYVLRAISAVEAKVLREAGGPVYVADEHPGYPRRQCLLDAEVGDELILVSHDPFARNSKYRSASPIFLHRFECDPASETSELPIQLTGRQLSVRSFDKDEMMIDAAVIDGHELKPTIESFFSDVLSETIHIHNATRGCWAVTVERRTT